jgi:hypothetical protein
MRADRVERRVVVEMLAVDVGDHRDDGRQLEERAVALVGLHHRKSLRPTRAFEPPIVPTRPPTTTVGSRPAKLRIVAVHRVWSVLP